MTKPRDPEALLAAYLEAGMEVLPDRVVDSVLDEVHRTRQRAGFGSWRTRLMSRTTLAAAAVVAVVALGGAFFLIQRGQPVFGGPEPVGQCERQREPARRRWPERHADPERRGLTIAGEPESRADVDQRSPWMGATPTVAWLGDRFVLVDERLRRCQHIHRRRDAGKPWIPTRATPNCSGESS